MTSRTGVPRRLRAAARRGFAAVAVTAAVGGLGALAGGCSTSASGSGTTQANYGFVKDAPGQDYVPADNRQAAPPLTGPAVSGGPINLATLRGKVVVINFWASWCAPCVAEAPTLAEIAKRTAPQAAFLGVATRDSKENAAAFARARSTPYPSLYDEDGTAAARFPVALSTLPSTLVLDRQGRVAVRFTGEVSYKQLSDAVNELIAERP
ncbi:MAG: TlpA family protein disulfide reductase [Frankiaceae bacterium]